MNLFGSWFNDLARVVRLERRAVGLTWRPSRALHVTGGVSVDRNVSDAQWVENLDGRRRSRTTSSAASTRRRSASPTRVNYTITPTLTLQIYAQPFVSAGGYTNFKELVDGRADQLRRPVPPYAYRGNPDFNYRSFRTTNVLRWEYRPGSALFVVWQQGREDVAPLGDFQFGRDFSGLVRRAGHQRVPRQDQPLVQFLKKAVEKPVA